MKEEKKTVQKSADKSKEKRSAALAKTTKPAKSAKPAAAKKTAKSVKPAAALKKTAPVKSGTKPKKAVPLKAVSKPKAAVKKKISLNTPSLDQMNDTMKGESKKFEIEDRRGYTEPSYEVRGEKTYELPEEYGETKITLLVQDPFWVHAYWEINEKTRKKFGIDQAGHNKSIVIRVYHAISNKYFDIPVNDSNRSWYFNISEANKYYYSEIGILESGKFTSIAKSNTVLVPTDRAAVYKMNEENTGGMSPEAMHAEEIFRMSGGYIIHKQSGSQMVSEWMGAPAMGASGGVSSHISSGSGGMIMRGLEKARGFWAELHTELIVYGATDPSAKVTVGGMPVHLTSDGKFSIRFYLKDGDHPVPFVARSADDIDTIEITPFVSKRTERKEKKNF